MSENRTKFYFNWKIIALIIGWAGVTVSVGLIVIYGPLILIYFTLLHDIVFLVMCGLNLISCISWLMGVSKQKLPLMMVPLLWWTMLMLFWLLFIGYQFRIAVMERHHPNKPYFFRNDPIYGITVFYTIYYVCAIICYKQMKAAIKPASQSQLPQFDASYRVGNGNEQTTTNTTQTTGDVRSLTARL